MEAQIKLQNGIYDIGEDKFFPNEEIDDQTEHFFEFKFDYNPEAECPNIDKFLGEVFKSEDLDLIYEIIAYTMIPANWYRKFFWLYGSGQNGKTTFLNMLSEFIGEKYCASVHLDDLKRSRFSLNFLKDILVNRMNDIRKMYKKSFKSGEMKRLVSDRDLRGEIKYIQTPIQFKNTAKHFFTANYKFNIDNFEDRAFKRRLVELEMNNKIDNPDTFILQKLTKEFSGLFNRCVEAFKRMRDNQTRLGD